MDEIYKIYKNVPEGELLLDVRRPDEFAEARIPSSINITHTEVGKQAEQLKKYTKIYVYCRSGGRSQVAAQILQEAGLTNLYCIKDSGMMDWIAAGYEVKS
ncbi:MAG: rhodanese-like domain-containing protein [Bdellovibrionaceae bacterium]|nr:rhodanese-like domain-containing protein [Pseudobdellovibrionaceae bacterium]